MGFEKKKEERCATSHLVMKRKGVSSRGGICPQQMSRKERYSSQKFKVILHFGVSCHKILSAWLGRLSARRGVSHKTRQLHGLSLYTKRPLPSSPLDSESKFDTWFILGNYNKVTFAECLYYQVLLEALYAYYLI